MRKIIVIIVAYLAVAFALCVGIANVMRNVPTLLPGARFSYLFFRSVLLFFTLFPALLCSAFLVAASISFGRSGKKALIRFSAAMIEHYKKVMIASLCMVFLLAMVREVGIPAVRAHQKRAEAAPYLLSEYLLFAEDALSRGDDELAREYAQSALKLEASNVTAQDIVDKSVAQQRQQKPTDTYITLDEESGISYKEIQNETVKSLIDKSKAAAEIGNWFYAHYYAQLAVASGTSKDINLMEARILASEAWNQLSNPVTQKNQTLWQYFDRKKQAYTDLMVGNNLKAYYQFLELSQLAEGATDPDVVYFLKVAKERLESECFFIDETLNLQHFESAQNIYFTVHRADDKTDAIYINGLTQVRNTGGMLTYLRGFTMYTYSRDGRLLRTVTTPYAKLVAQSADSFSQAAKDDYGINDSFGFVPTLKLKSVARDSQDEINEPVYEFTDLVSPAMRDTSDFIVLPMSIDDFMLACDASLGADKMNLPALFRINANASEFGYASEIFGAALVRRLLYPLVMLLLFLFCASFAWNYRLEARQVFKFKWILVLPFSTLLLYLIIEILLFAADLLCYALIAVVGGALLPIAAALCLVLLVALSVTFLSRTSD